MGTKYGTGIPNRLCGKATSRVTTNPSTLHLGAGHTNTGRISQTPPETGNTTCGVSFGDGLLLQYISCPQERRGTKTCHQSQSTEQLCSPGALQDGGYSHSEGAAGIGRLASKSRSEGCLLRNSHSPNTSEVLTFPVPGESFPIHLPSIRPVLSSVGVHKNPETSTGHLTTKRGPYDRLHRRHPTDSRIKGPSSRPCPSPGAPAREPRLYHQHREVSAHPKPDHRVSGPLSQLHRHGATTSPSKNKQIRAEARKMMRMAEPPSARTLARLLGKMNSTTCVIPPAPLFYRSLQMALSNTLETHSQNYEGLVMLLPDSLEELQWWDTEMSKWNGKTLLKREVDMVIDSDASLQGWGARCGTQTTRGAWSQRETALHINCLELLAATLAVQSFAKGQSRLNILLRIDNTTAVAYINHLGGGGGSLERASQSDKESVDVVPGEEHTHHSPTPPGDPEYRRRRRVTVTDRQDGLETVTKYIPQDTANIWSTGSGSLCDPPVCSVPTLLQLAARSICRSNRCISPGVDPHQGVCQSTLEPGRQNTCSGTDSQNQPSAGSTSVEIPAMVPNTATHAGGLSQTDSSRNRNNGQQRQFIDAPTTSRVAHLRERYRNQQLSEDAMDLMLSSWRTKTNKSYDSLFAKWHRWCSERSSDPFSGPIAQVANFLAYLYKEGYQYSSVNAYRSAISSVHEKVEGYTVGQHPLICRLVKGVFQSRPPLPRYTHTWDVQKVLNYLDTLGDNQMLSLKHLTWKVTMLLALSRPSRSADLSKLDISKRVYKPDGVCFYPSALAKQSRSTSQINNFFFPSLPEGNRLCPVSTLKEYESRTHPLRGRETNLLIAIIKPHKAVSSSTVARWLKSLLEASGIDVSIFGAHSVRGASSSAAASAGISTSDILKAAGWSSESTFQRFYYKPLDNPSFGRAVLNRNNQQATNDTVDI